MCAYRLREYGRTGIGESVLMYNIASWLIMEDAMFEDFGITRSLYDVRLDHDFLIFDKYDQRGVGYVMLNVPNTWEYFGNGVVWLNQSIKLKFFYNPDNKFIELDYLDKDAIYPPFNMPFMDTEGY